MREEFALDNVFEGTSKLPGCKEKPFGSSL